MNSSKKPTVLFSVISIIALIWNIMGVMAYLADAYVDDATLQALSTEDQAYYANVPSWVTGAYAIAVFAGALGSLALILRKKVAFPILLVSAIAVLAQVSYTFFMQNDITIQGTRMIMPIAIIVISLFLVFFSRNGVKKGILR